MSISFSGLASGLDTDSWVSALVSAKQLSVTTLQSQLSDIKSEQSSVSEVKSAFSKLQSALQTLTDAKLGKFSDLFAANKVTSGNTSLFTASVTTDAVRDTYDITVKQLATVTSAQSVTPASKFADSSTLLSDIGITDGAVTVYVDGAKTTVNIDENDTVADLQSRFSLAGATLSIDADTGFFSVAATNSGAELKIGANTDTSNIVSLLGLIEVEGGGYESATPVYQANGSTLLTDALAGFNTQITEGTFTIGNETFTIDSTTTLDGIISKINNSLDSQVYASWDASKGSLVLRSNVEGASYINISAGTSNFTDVMGLTISEWNADGDVTSSRLLTDAQTLGKNAKLTINGTEITSTSNTVTADISRIAGLTINLKGVSEDGSNTSTLTVEQDSTKLVNALNDVISAYNGLMTAVEDKTSVEGGLHGETSLKGIYSNMRTIMNSSSANNGSFVLLSQIGISTDSASNDLNADSVSLKLDENKLKEVLANNGDSVKELLLGEQGVLTRVKSTIDSALYTNGYFSVKEGSLKDDITSMNKKISKRQDNIDTYKTRLETKFAAMEQVISKLNNNYSSLMSYM